MPEAASSIAEKNKRRNVAVLRLAQRRNSSFRMRSGEGNGPPDILHG